MQIFLDTADLNQIKHIKELGILDGVTTNPSIMANYKERKSEHLKELLALVAPGPVSIEVISTEYKPMIEEAEELIMLGENVVVKLPMTEDGIRATATLTKKGIKTNVTLIFSANQALIAAKAGATYVSPFVGRLHDIGQDGIVLIEQIREIFLNYDFQTQVLMASDRTPMDTLNSALIGADAVTIKYENYLKLFRHPLTDKGLENFLSDWNQN